MKNIVLAAALALIAVPALAVGPEAFTVDVSRGYAVTAPGQQQAQGNWAPRGQQAQEEATPAPRAMKASGKPRSNRNNAAGHSATPATKAAPATAPAAKH